MCRWLAYSGSPLYLDELLYKPEHSLIDRRLDPASGSSTTNGDGFGVGWYDGKRTPALYRNLCPPWDDQNLRELCQHIRSPLVFAHVRASTGTPVQQTNCHPFRHGNWLWMHNGLIDGFDSIKRELVLGIDPLLYRHIKGSSDTEILFFLALTYGLDHDPVAAVQQAVGYVEKVGADRGISNPIRMSAAATNGKDVWGFRYSTEGQSPSLYYSTKIETLREQYPHLRKFRKVSHDTRLIVSEPLSSLAGAWNEVPESTCAVIVADGEDWLIPFTPQPADARVVLLDQSADALIVEHRGGAHPQT